LPLTTLGQETRWAYSTTPPSPHGALLLKRGERGKGEGRGGRKWRSSPFALAKKEKSAPMTTGYAETQFTHST